MFYFIHVLAAIVISKYVLKYSSNLYLSIFLIILLTITSHFLLDIIPHRDSLFEGKFSETYTVKFDKKSLALEISDILLSLIIISLVFLKLKNPLYLLAIFFSLFPDIIKILYFLNKENSIIKNYLTFHSKIQTEVSWPLGILIQAIAVILLIIFIFFF